MRGGCGEAVGGGRAACCCGGAVGGGGDASGVPTELQGPPSYQDGGADQEEDLLLSRLPRPKVSLYQVGLFVAL